MDSLLSRSQLLLPVLLKIHEENFAVLDGDSVTNDRWRKDFIPFSFEPLRLCDFCCYLRLTAFALCLGRKMPASTKNFMTFHTMPLLTKCMAYNQQVPATIQ